MKLTPPLRVSRNWNGIVTIFDATGEVVSEIYCGQRYDRAQNTRVAPTPEDCVEVAQALVNAFNASRNDLVAHLHQQRVWSERTFGPGDRAAGVVDHIRKELREIEANPRDLAEWIDVAILAFDGAWRAGYSPEQIADALRAKQSKNEARKWPDWRTMPADGAIEHDRSAEAPP